MMACLMGIDQTSQGLVGWLLGRLVGWFVCRFSIRLLRRLVWLVFPDGF